MKIRDSADAARLIKTLRIEQGLTQQEVADTVGITRQSFARIERGHGGASFETLLKVFATLDISVLAASNAADSAALVSGSESKRDGSTLAGQVDALRKLGNAIAHSGAQELLASGALGESALKANQSLRRSLSRVVKGGEAAHGPEA